MFVTNCFSSWKFSLLTSDDESTKNKTSRLALVGFLGSEKDEMKYKEWCNIHKEKPLVYMGNQSQNSRFTRDNFWFTGLLIY